MVSGQPQLSAVCLPADPSSTCPELTQERRGRVARFGEACFAHPLRRPQTAHPARRVVHPANGADSLSATNHASNNASSHAEKALPEPRMTWTTRMTASSGGLPPPLQENVEPSRLPHPLAPSERGQLCPCTHKIQSRPLLATLHSLLTGESKHPTPDLRVGSSRLPTTLPTTWTSPQTRRVWRSVFARSGWVLGRFGSVSLGFS
jgi:hypothetical protein